MLYGVPHRDRLELRVDGHDPDSLHFGLILVAANTDKDTVLDRFVHLLLLVFAFPAFTTGTISSIIETIIAISVIIPIAIFITIIVSIVVIVITRILIIPITVIVVIITVVVVIFAIPSCIVNIESVYVLRPKSRLLDNNLQPLSACIVPVSLLFLERLHQFVIGLVLHCSEHAGEKECMVMDVPLAHSEHNVWRGPHVVVVLLRYDRDAPHKVGDLF